MCYRLPLTVPKSVKSPTVLGSRICILFIGRLQVIFLAGLDKPPAQSQKVLLHHGQVTSKRRPLRGIGAL